MREPLSHAVLEDLHEKTLDLLSRWGVSFEDEDALEFFRARGCLVTESRVKIPQKIVEQALGSVPAAFWVSARSAERDFGVGEGYPQAYGPGAGMSLLLDHDGNVRDATTADMDAFLKLAHTSKYCSVSAAGLLYPADLRADLALHTQLFHALLLSDKPLFGLTQDKSYAADSIAMARIASDQRDNVCMGVVNSRSPLAWDGAALGSMRVFAEERQPLVVAACAMSGLTSHVSLSGTLVSTNAELLSGIVYMQLLSPGTPVIYGNTSAISDMATLAIAIGAPETTLLAAATAQIARRYRIPCRTGGALCDSSLVDMQAGIESGFNLLGTVLSDADFVLQSLGVMQGFLSLSFEKWLIDEEILDHAHRISRGIDAPCPALVDEIIAAVSDKYRFLGHESTVERFRNEFLIPVLSVRGNAADCSIIDAAAKLRGKRLAEYECPALPADAENALRQYVYN